MLKPEKELDEFDQIIKGMTMNIIIMSYAKTKQLRELTENAIRTCELSRHLCDFNYIVVESCVSAQPYHIPDSNNRIGTLYKEESREFNYNACANMAFDHCKNNYVAICNNDLHFNYKWADKLLKSMFRHNVISASPLSITSTFTRDITPQVDGVIFGDAINGYRVGSVLAGWCIVINRPAVLGKFENDKLDEDCSFWHADNVYAQQLNRAGLEHILCLDSIVNHLESKTLFTMGDKVHSLTHGQDKAYEEYLKRIGV